MQTVKNNFILDRWILSSEPVLYSFLFFIQIKYFLLFLSEMFAQNLRTSQWIEAATFQNDEMV